jgi:TM2 domain-containing membrane protein YozV
MSAAEWFYIGHYGQLGPLTREQVAELIDGGVVERDTYVWRNGMADWLPAERVVELQSAFQASPIPVAPPPPPSARPAATMPPPTVRVEMPTIAYMPVTTTPMNPAFMGVQSDKSRILAGLLQFLPLGGIGRMYLGFSAIGVLQFILSFCMGVGYVWSIIDGIIILTGGTNRDGYGRVLPD